MYHPFLKLQYGMIPICWSIEGGDFHLGTISLGCTVFQLCCACLDSLIRKYKITRYSPLSKKNLSPRYSKSSIPLPDSVIVGQRFSSLLQYIPCNTFDIPLTSAIYHVTQQAWKRNTKKQCNEASIMLKQTQKYLVRYYGHPMKA